MQNMFLDVLVPYSRSTPLAGLVGAERRYAFIDFETTILPDTPLNDAEREIAFKRDVYCLADALESKLRVRIFLYVFASHTDFTVSSAFRMWYQKLADCWTP